MAVFCISQDFEAYKKDSKENDPDWYEENEDYLENSPWAQSDWYDEEKRYYLDWLEEKLKESGLNARNFADAGKVCDGDEVCTVGTSFRFAGIDFDLVVSIDFEAGYYDGFKLDWNIKEICGIDTDSLKWIDAEDLTDALTGTWTGWGSYREWSRPPLPSPRSWCKYAGGPLGSPARAASGAGWLSSILSGCRVCSGS